MRISYGLSNTIREPRGAPTIGRHAMARPVSGTALDPAKASHRIELCSLHSAASALLPVVFQYAYLRLANYAAATEAHKEFQESRTVQQKCAQ